MAAPRRVDIRVDGTPESLRVRALRDGEVVLEASRAIEYEEERPNGPECPPVCEVAMAQLAVD